MHWNRPAARTRQDGPASPHQGFHSTPLPTIVRQREHRVRAAGPATWHSPYQRFHRAAPGDFIMTGSALPQGEMATILRCPSHHRASGTLRPGPVIAGPAGQPSAHKAPGLPAGSVRRRQCSSARPSNLRSQVRVAQRVAHARDPPTAMRSSGGTPRSSSMARSSPPLRARDPARRSPLDLVASWWDRTFLRLSICGW
jgi:hypothetical protein